MLNQFLSFVLSVFRMIVSLFQNTDIGGISYEAVLVSIFVLTLITRVILIIMK